MEIVKVVKQRIKCETESLHFFSESKLLNTSLKVLQLKHDDFGMIRINFAKVETFGWRKIEEIDLMFVFIIDWIPKIECTFYNRTNYLFLRQYLLFQNTQFYAINVDGPFKSDNTFYLQQILLDGQGLDFRTQRSRNSVNFCTNNFLEPNCCSCLTLWNK